MTEIDLTPQGFPHRRGVPKPRFVPSEAEVFKRTVLLPMIQELSVEERSSVEAELVQAREPESTGPQRHVASLILRNMSYEDAVAFSEELVSKSNESLGISSEILTAIETFIKAHVALETAREALNDVPAADLVAAYALASSAAEVSQDKAFQKGDGSLPIDERLRLVKIRDGAASASIHLGDAVQARMREKVGDDEVYRATVQARDEKKKKLGLNEVALQALNLE